LNMLLFAYTFWAGSPVSNVAWTEGGNNSSYSKTGRRQRVMSA
jgi:hypothetical protein